MMKPFDVLDQNTLIAGEHFLEASAGTGKTFTIENIALRCILEEEALSLEEILIVTFTKVATYDLKIRLRHNLEKTLKILQKKEKLPAKHFLQKIIQDENSLKRASRALKEALFSFDRASIFTLHSFCYNMLQENSFAASIFIDEEPKNAFPKLLKETLCYSLDPALLSFAQISQLLKKYGTKLLLEKLSKYTPKGKNGFSFTSLFQEFQNKITLFQKYLPLPSLEGSFKAIAVNYLKNSLISENDLTTGLTLLEQGIKEPTLELFDKILENKLSICQIIADDKRKKRSTNVEDLPYFQFFQEVKEELYPIIEKSCDIEQIFATLGEDLAQKIEKRTREDDLLSSDSILKEMQKAIINCEFRQKVQSKYRVVIVDEFQDTDPIQWAILQKLFLTDEYKPLAFYLVGDPKQSIYAFRNADLYTYFKALDTLGTEKLGSLDTNFRSCSNLTAALNAFFNNSPILQLPSIDKKLPYLPVKPGKDASTLLNDGKQALHFILSQEKKPSKGEVFFSYIAKEIISLKKQGISFSQIACLVHDRYQGEKLFNYLNQRKIPTSIKSHLHLKNSVAAIALEDIIKAALCPLDENALKRALFSPLIEAQIPEDVSFWENVSLQFVNLQNILMHEGLPHFFKALLETPLPGVASLLNSPHFNDLSAIMELFLDYNNKKEGSFLQFFDYLKEGDCQNDERFLRKNSPDEEGVQIMTIHASKGLEFEVVFALGISTKDNKETIDEEEKAEKLRQLYVALTRGKLRCYVTFEKNPSAIELFFQSINIATDEKSIIDYLEKHNFSYSLLDEHIEDVSWETQETLSFTPPPPLPSIPQPGKVLSFSALHDSQKEYTPKSAESDTLLPLGTQTGIFFHKILEKILSQHCFQEEKFSKIIDEEIFLSSFQGDKSTVFNLIKKVLNMSLPPLKEDFCLAMLQNVQTEIEFFYPKGPHEFLKGFIDLIFIYEGKYYILDWKTNFLGNNKECYSANALQKAMENEDYFLQGAIYSEALERHFSQDLQNEGFKNQGFKNHVFGGIFYIFLRALLFSEKDLGVFHFFPKKLVR